MVHRSGYFYQRALEGTLLKLARRVFLMVFVCQTSTVDDWVYLADYDDNHSILHVSSHLACFAGGNWILGALRMIVVVVEFMSL